MKIIKVLILNFIFLAIILSCYNIYYYLQKNAWYFQTSVIRVALYYREGLMPFTIYLKSFDTFYKERKDSLFRPVEGLEYTDKTPIVLLGCSFAYGHILPDNEILSARLVEKAKRTVYNLGYPGWGVQNIIYLLQNNELFKNPKKLSKGEGTQYFIYWYINDHLRRMLFSDEILAKLVIDGKAINVKNVDVSYKETKSYDLDEKLEKTTYQYVAKFDSVLSNKNVQYKVGENLVDAENLQEAVVSLVESYEVVETGVTADVRVTGETVSTPNQSEIALATGITLAVAFVYCAFRYRLSRACSMLTVSAGVTTITYGLLALTRLATAPVSAILLPIVALLSLLTSLFYFSREKELDKEEKAYDAEKRSALISKAASLAALPIFTFTLIGGYLAINFFGFGPVELTILFGAVIVGTALFVVAALIVMGPLAGFFDRLFAKVHLPKLRRHKDNKQHTLKPKTSEPQETIFIGIND